MSSGRQPAGSDPPDAEAPLWLLSSDQVREQLLVIAAGSKQLAVPTRAVDGVGERGPIHPVPHLTPALLGAVVFRGALVPLISTDRLDPRPQPRTRGGAEMDLPLLDAGLLSGPLLLVLREGERLLAIGFERFVGYRSPAQLADPPGGDAAKWVKATGTIDEIPAFVVDTPELFEYCKARSR